MRLSNFDPDQLLPNRCYTFQELTVLYDSPGIYIALYNLLDSKSQDYRLRVFRQLRKRDVLKSFAAEDLDRLAGKLNIKPLYDWKEQEFGHISGLTAEDVASLLVHFEDVRHLLPSIHHRPDVVLALKNKDFLARFDCMEDLKSHITQIDAEWRALVEAMALSEEFLAQYQGNILQFLCSNGAYIVRTYEGCLGPELRAAFYRVVKAELMGQLDVLKSCSFLVRIIPPAWRALRGPDSMSLSRNLRLGRNTWTALMGRRPHLWRGATRQTVSWSKAIS